jgi:hypothetical protein
VEKLAVSAESKQLPKTLWRVVATGGSRAYWEPASRTYAQLGWAERWAVECRARGATVVKIFRADVEWHEIEQNEELTSG